ncbi:MAG: MarR family winged helix-turn-helix transcriptional regulator [Hyphomicrobiales bacterium]|nr:MarR family winged helix-turn-helix transcriptional regulator [Hyphomicrobiales bacterium]MDE2113598.1 winged helix-turn-helix transcriptional regulator [Hyphomicrobiales bacterium]
MEATRSKPILQNPAPHSGGPVTPVSDAAGPAPCYDLIELLFFAYRDFVGDADRVLEIYGFGRAHHRVLHFVHRRPGLNIAQLLEILAITKQSLNRVLKDLVEQGFIDSRFGENDRRQRELFVTPAGESLALQLAKVQALRLQRATAPLPRDTIKSFLLNMIDEEARAVTLAQVNQHQEKAR